MELNVNDIVRLKKNSRIFSIKNQTNFLIADDEIVIVTHTIRDRADYVFAKRMRLLFNWPPLKSEYVEDGHDEWTINATDCEPL